MLATLFISERKKFVLQCTCVLLPVTVYERERCELPAKLRGSIDAAANG